MNIKQLKQAIENIPDDTDVLFLTDDLNAVEVEFFEYKELEHDDYCGWIPPIADESYDEEYGAPERKFFLILSEEDYFSE